MKILPVAAELLLVDGRTDGQRDMKKPKDACRNFATTPGIV